MYLYYWKPCEEKTWKLTKKKIIIPPISMSVSTDFYCLAKPGPKDVKISQTNNNSNNNPVNSFQ